MLIKKISLLIASVFISTCLYSQSIAKSTDYVERYNKDTRRPYVVYGDSDHFLTFSDYIPKGKEKKLYMWSGKYYPVVQLIDKNDPLKNVTWALKKPINGEQGQYFKKCLNIDGKVYLFVNSFNYEKKEMSIISCELDVENQKYKQIKTLTTVPIISKINKKIKYLFANSNESLFMYYWGNKKDDGSYDFYFARHDSGTIDAFNFKSINISNGKTSYSNNNNNNFLVFVNRDKSLSEFEIYDLQGNMINSIPFSFNNGENVIRHSWRFDKEDNIHFFGIYGEKGKSKGFFYSKISSSTFKIERENFIPYTEEIVKGYYEDLYKKQKSINLSGFSSIGSKFFNNKIYYIMEERDRFDYYYKDEFAMDTHTDYTYKDFFILMYDVESKELTLKRIDKKQKGPGNLHMSGSLFAVNDKISLIYNDNLNNTSVTRKASSLNQFYNMGLFELEINKGFKKKLITDKKNDKGYINPDKVRFFSNQACTILYKSSIVGVSEDYSILYWDL